MCANSRRFHDWPARLAHFLEDARGRPFVWGQTDCCLFSCDAIQRLTGVDPAAVFRGRYATAREAYRLLRRVTGKRRFDLAIGEIARRHGFKQIPPTFAQRGDLVLIRLDKLAALGIVNGRGQVETKGPRGSVCVALRAGLAAWRIV